MDVARMLDYHGGLDARTAKGIADKLKTASVLVDFDDADGIITPAADVREQLVSLQLKDIEGPLKRSVLIQIALMDNLATTDICETCFFSEADEDDAKGLIHDGAGTPVAVASTDDEGKLAFKVMSNGAGTVSVTSAEHAFSPALDNSEIVVITFS